MQKFAPRGQVKTRDIVARESGFGSGENYRKAQYIYENGNKDLIQQLDDEELSINKIIVLIKHYVTFEAWCFLFVCFGKIL
ncbi:hypothetical protein [Clostridium botulinum]|uniref:hypothetical protein n=1 Tax=Clostridium botulinum TaxID=1491 RepID=UPI0013F0E8C6|nr:hypothetical protein [Clostridium botulinum]MBY6898543.1 hypothetical protein [Clostridium botulinum]MBY6912829.1 hypothetical protein [Clostridium botulinum]MCR1178721.1 hypothetical protein [Clostridium botulinum]NFM79754.1 hypothetical protein [Clostridium botulinum]